MLRTSPSLVAIASLLIWVPAVEARGIVDQTDPVAVQYRIEGGPLRDLDARFTPAEIGLLEKLNRADRKHLPRLDRYVVPTEWRDELDHSPFPPVYDAVSAMSKVLIVDQPSQVFAAYEFGRLAYWGPASTGRQAKPTPSGRFHLNWRARSRLSTLSGEWRLNWYFNFHNLRGLAFHEFDLPGLPASHACVRLLARDAQWIFAWGGQWTLDAKGQLLTPGTPVIILGHYDFSAAAPARTLEFLAKGIVLPASLPE